MDVEISISISLSINKLQDLLRDEETTSNPRLQKEIQTAINNLHALNQFLKDLDPRTAKILKEVYSVEDATDTFLMIKEIQHIENSREQDQRKDSVSYAQKMKFFCSHKKKASYQIHFAGKMEKFNDEVRHLVERKGAETSDIENINNTRLLRLQNDRDHLRQRQHWGRISNFCLEDETHVVGLQQQTNDLVVRLIPQLIRNDGQSGGNEIQDLDDLRHCDQVISDFCLEDETHVKLIPQLIPNEGQSGGNEIQFLDNHQHRDQVIAVVGEGGSGKTTLARSVYNRVDVKRHFTIRAWVRIPSVFKARDVLVDILAQINQDELVDATISEDGLMRRLNKVLKGTRFLIVLDDVETLQVWKSLVTTLSFSAQGGKIIIIVRNTDYLPPNGHYSTLNICKLNNEESWKLFSNKVRIAEEELNNNSELILLKEQILKICGGLPSTIVLLGGLLSTKEKSCEEWTRVLFAIVANNSPSEDILGLSYQDLPSEVKPCFLYMGLFPKRFEIPVRRLMHLWCAEGFLTTLVPIKIDPEDVAEMFLEELVTRNMVDVVRWVADGVPKTCCMPNVIYDFFSSKAANHVGFQRLAANVETDYLPSSLGCIQNTRSYVAFDTRVPITSTMAIDEFIGRIRGKRGFGLLRVLDVEGVYRPFLSSDQIGRLFLLTYLSLRSTFIDHLPEWVGDMPYLETLDLKHTNISSFNLSKANKLRHLYLNSTYDPENSSYLPESTNLRTLQGLIIPSFAYCIAEYSNAFRMIRLVKLGLLRCEDAAATLPAEWINQLTELQSLKLKLIDSKGSVSFIRLWSLAEHHKLQELYLLAILPESVINVGFLPPNLRKLTLSLSELEADPMPVLGKLPHLNILRLLSRSYVGEKMTCLSTGFPKLRILKLWDLRVLQVWTVEEGAMPSLRELEIRSCNSLKLPQELKNATNLKELVLTNMPDDFRAAAEESFHGRDVYVRNNNPRNSDPIQWPTQNPYDAAAEALKGLTFIATKSGEEGNDWNAVDKRFEKLNASTNDPNLEVTLEIRDDSVADPIVHMVTVGGGEEGEIHDNSVASLSRIPSGRSTMTSKRYDQMKSVADGLKGLKFITTTKSGEDGNDWNAVEKRFEKLTASTDGFLHSSMFGECIGMKGDSKEFAGELFRAVARKHKINGEYINKTQLEDFWHQISDESFGSRLKTFFDIVDKDADGKITKEEIKEIISLSASANKLSKIQKQAEEYAALVMEALDPEGVGETMVNKLETLLLQAPNKYEKVLSMKHKPTQENNPLERWYQKMKYFLINHWQKVWILMLWLGIVLGLFVYMFVQYRNKAAYDVMGNCVCIAKGAAETLKFNMALILLPVCRKTITWLRNHTKLGGVVPFDNNLDFHMVIAAGIAIGVILHGGAHLTCDFPRLIHATKEEYEPMKPYFGEEQPQNYWWFLKRVEGVTGIIMVVLMAIAFTLANPWFRRNKLKNMPEPFQRLTSFNAFWYSHLLFVIVYVLLIVHGIYIYLSKTWYQKTTWMYIAVPVLLYTCERLIRAFRSSTETVEIIKALVYPDVLALRMSKPEGFKFESGQYMFVNCSAVSPFEWHPFSITSAPGDDYLSIHIRALGDWTRQIKSVFSKLPQPPPIEKSGTSREEGSNISGFPEIKIDGPYGAPAQDYKTYDVVLLIWLGIGATPMISIVKDIINNIQTIEDNSESALENGNYSSKAATQSTFRTRKAYSYWVTNNHRSFDWFKEIMNEVAEADKKGVIELHNYCSSVFKEGDARSAMISMLQSLHHAKNGVDVVSETRVKSHFAKPNWRQVYKNIAACHPNSTIGVFYSGTPAAIKQLRELALEFSDKTTTVFEFHKENF